MDVLVIVDMQEAMLLGDPKFELPQVIDRINRLAESVRRRGGRVVFVQHDGAPGGDFAPYAPGWAILRSIPRADSDLVVRKSMNDAFFGTSLQSDLELLVGLQ